LSDAAACGGDADRHLRLDVRHDRVEATLMDRERAAVTTRDVEVARAITAALSDGGFRTGGSVTATPMSMSQVASVWKTRWSIPCGRDLRSGSNKWTRPVRSGTTYIST